MREIYRFDNLTQGNFRIEDLRVPFTHLRKQPVCLQSKAKQRQNTPCNGTVFVPLSARQLFPVGCHVTVETRISSLIWHTDTDSGHNFRCFCQ